MNGVTVIGGSVPNHTFDIDQIEVGDANSKPMAVVKPNWDALLDRAGEI